MHWPTGVNGTTTLDAASRGAVCKQWCGDEMVWQCRCRKLLLTNATLTLRSSIGRRAGGPAQKGRYKYLKDIAPPGCASASRPPTRGHCIASATGRCESNGAIRDDSATPRKSAMQRAYAGRAEQKLVVIDVEQVGEPKLARTLDGCVHMRGLTIDLPDVISSSLTGEDGLDERIPRR